MSINFNEIAALVIGGIFTWVAMGKRNERVKLITIGIKAKGEVIRLEETPSSDNSAGTFKPVVKFTTSDRQSITKAQGISTNPCPYRVGQKVTVFYDHENAEHFTIDDGPSVSIEITIFAVGIVSLLIAAVLFITSN